MQHPFLDFSGAAIFLFVCLQVDLYSIEGLRHHGRCVKNNAETSKIMSTITVKDGHPNSF